MNGINVEVGNRGGLKYDIFKLVLAFMVFGIHTYVLPEHLRPILRSAVPMFFMLTSFFYFRKPDASSWPAIWKYSGRILKLYLFWFIVLIAPTVYFKGWFKEGLIIGFAQMLRSFLFGSTFVASWFLSASVLAIIIVARLSRCVSNFWMLVLASLVYIACCVSSNYWGLVSGNDYVVSLDVTYQRFFCSPYNSFPVALVWVVLGKMMRESERLPNILISLAIVVIGVALLYVESDYIISGGIQRADDCYLSLLVLCPAIFMTIMQLKDSGRGSSIRVRNSSTILYCAHGTLFPIVNHVCRSAGMPAIYAILITLAIIAVLIWFVIKHENHKGLRWLRFAH